MIKKSEVWVTKLTLFVAALGVAVPLLAYNSPVQAADVVKSGGEATTRIGVLQEQTVLESSLYGKDINKQVQVALSTKQGDLASKEEAMQKKREGFQRDEPVLSEKERNEKKQELVKLQRELQGLAEQYEMEMQDLHQEKLQGFRKMLMEELGVIAKNEKLGLVIPQHIVFYYESGIDLTDKVVKALDQRYKTAGNSGNSKKT